MDSYTLKNDESALLEGVMNGVTKLITEDSLKQAVAENSIGDHFPRKIFAELSELGLSGLSISEDYDGISASPPLQAAIFQTLAQRDLGPAIFFSVHSMVSSLISKFGDESQKKQYLSKLASGEVLGAFGLSEPNAGSDAASLRTTATPDGEHYILNGEKAWITSAGAAHLYVVFARLPNTEGREGITAFIVDHDLSGLTYGSHEDKMGCKYSPIASLYFDNCKVPAANLLGEAGEGYRVALSGLTGGRVNIGACACGIAHTALNKTVEYLKTRKQFGKPLADLQGLQFKVAEMKMKLDAAELLVARAAEGLMERPKDIKTRLDASIAKCFATDAAMQIATDAVQLHGAMGYIRSSGIEKLMGDAKMLQIVEGANEVQRSIIARQLFAI